MSRQLFLLLSLTPWFFSACAVHDSALQETVSYVQTPPAGWVFLERVEVEGIQHNAKLSNTLPDLMELAKEKTEQIFVLTALEVRMEASPQWGVEHQHRCRVERVTRRENGTFRNVNVKRCEFTDQPRFQRQLKQSLSAEIWVKQKGAL